MKKYLALLLALAMVFCLAACGEDAPAAGTNGEDKTSAPAAQTTPAEDNDPPSLPVTSGEITLEAVMNAPESPESDFKVTSYDENSVEIVGYLGNDTILVIPQTIKGKTVAGIGKYAFANDYYPNVKAVRLPDTVKVIDNSAFALNPALEIVVCGNGLETINQAAFQGAENLRELILGESLVAIGPLGIAGCKSLKTVTLPESATDIAAIAFAYAPEGFTIIGAAGSAAEQHANEQGINFKAK